MTDESKVHVVKDQRQLGQPAFISCLYIHKLAITSGTFVAVVWYNHGSQQK
jgi:hypothetical protein